MVPTLFRVNAGYVNLRKAFEGGASVYCGLQLLSLLRQVQPTFGLRC